MRNCGIPSCALRFLVLGNCERPASLPSPPCPPSPTHPSAALPRRGRQRLRGGQQGHPGPGDTLPPEMQQEGRRLQRTFGSGLLIGLGGPSQEGRGPYMMFSCCSVPKCLTLCDPMDCSPPGSSGDFPDKSTGVGCHFLLQGILLIQELNPLSPALAGIGRWILYH